MTRIASFCTLSPALVDLSDLSNLQITSYKNSRSGINRIRPHDRNTAQPKTEKWLSFPSQFSSFFSHRLTVAEV